MDCDRLSSARATVFVLISRCTLQKQEITLWSGGHRLPQGLIMLLLWPTTSFNLLDGIWESPDCDGREAECTELEGRVTQRGSVFLYILGVCACVCVSSRQQCAASNILWRDQWLGLWLRLHTEGRQQSPTSWFNVRLIDCLIDSLSDWFDCFLYLSWNIFL